MIHNDATSFISSWERNIVLTLRWMCRIVREKDDGEYAGVWVLLDRRNDEIERALKTGDVGLGFSKDRAQQLQP